MNEDFEISDGRSLFRTSVLLFVYQTKIENRLVIKNIMINYYFYYLLST